MNFHQSDEFYQHEEFLLRGLIFKMIQKFHQGNEFLLK